MRSARWLAAALALASAPELFAQDRLTRRFGTDHGLVPASVLSLAQDATGFLWIGTSDGLYRFDGLEMRRWAPDDLRGRVIALAAGPGGETLALAEHGALFAATTHGVAPVGGAGGEAVVDAVGVAWDGAGCLWIGRTAGLDGRCGTGEWLSWPRVSFDGEEIRGVRSARGAGALALTPRAVWRATPGSPPRLLARAERPVDALELGGGRTLVLTWSGRLLRAAPEGTEELLTLPARGISLALRGDSVWTAFDRYLALLGPGREPEVLGPWQGLDGGGTLLADREGSLWLGTFNGLLQYPEPETLIWRDRDGLPSAHVRYLARAGDALWAATWQGTGVLRPADPHWRAAAPPEWARSWGRVCDDRRGLLWLALAPDLAAVRDGSLAGRFAGPRTLFACAPAADGGLWLGTDRGLFRTRPGEPAIQRHDALPFGRADSPVRAVLHDRTGRLWVSNDETVCTAQRPESPDWRCTDVPGAVHLTGLVELPGGAIWASSERLGVLRFGAGGWRPVAGAADALPSVAVLALRPAPSGGLWVAGHGIAHRVAERADGGLEVVERLSAWHGLHTLAVHDVLEDGDGTVWVATFDGVARIPAAARSPRRPPPAVAVIDGRVDREPIRLDRPLELPFDRNRLELRFAALSYRDPALVRLQLRSGPGETWTELRGGTTFRWVDLPPGDYRAEVRASLDGSGWTPRPAAFAFRVAPPWWRRPWALALFAAAAGAALLALHRARIAIALRLERQRTRIAMDLHDQMGSALGTIGVLSGVLAEQEPPGERRRLAGEIAVTASELATALADIVWSLRPQPATLGELAARLAERGQRIFAAGEVDFEAESPEEPPAAPLPPPVRRAVLSIGLEALHNAARHACARRVRLTLAPEGGGWWRLAVRDDGVGLPGEPALGGMGIAGMRRRADEIGARLELERPPGGGTTVALRFRPGGRRAGAFGRVSHDHAAAPGAPGGETRPEDDRRDEGSP